ncbi:hypothetical protein HK098_001875 [Nowakowskiella sp. JEL0407]|nr:hypothetical protein HK098_001875 [Nowakowskiella sp. JEL0407]
MRKLSTIPFWVVFLVTVVAQKNQIYTGIRPLCGADNRQVNCSTFAPVDGIAVGINLDIDRKDSITEFNNRLQPWSNSPAAYGLFAKIAGSVEVDFEKDRYNIGFQLDTFIRTLRGKNALMVVSCDPWAGFQNVTDKAISEFADKMAEINSYGIPVLVRTAHEMNAPWYIYGQQPTAYIAFHRKIVNAVRAKTQFTKFLFAPNIGTSYPWSTGGYNYTISPTSPDYPLLDTNGDGKLTAEDDPYTPFYPGDE